LSDAGSYQHPAGSVVEIGDRTNHPAGVDQPFERDFTRGNCQYRFTAIGETLLVGSTGGSGGIVLVRLTGGDADSELAVSDGSPARSDRVDHTTPALRNHDSRVNSGREFEGACVLDGGTEDDAVLTSICPDRYFGVR
jgi:hypothetical protein